VLNIRVILSIQKLYNEKQTLAIAARVIKVNVINNAGKSDGIVIFNT